VGEGLVLAQEALGRGRVRLSELSELPDERLGLLRPSLRPGWRLRVRSERAVALHADGREVVVCEAPGDSDRLALLGLGPRRTLAGLARDLSRHLELPWPAAFSTVRSHFLRLVRLRICVPADGPERDTSPQSARPSPVSHQVTRPAAEAAQPPADGPASAPDERR